VRSCVNWFTYRYSIKGQYCAHSSVFSKKREQALDILRPLSELWYVRFKLDAKAKLLTYRITDYEPDYCARKKEARWTNPRGFPRKKKGKQRYGRSRDMS